MKKIILTILCLPAVVYGITTSYKNNGYTGKLDMVTSGVTTDEVSGLSNGFVHQPHFNLYSAARSAERAALGSAAYQPTSAFDPAGAAAAVKDTTTKTGILKGDGVVISPAANSDLPAMTATVGGAVPPPPNDATKFLNGAAGFTVPPGTYSLPITDSVSTTSSTTAASATAVKAANDNANTRLPASSQAVDSNKLNGQLASFYQTALGYTPMKTDYSNAGTAPTWNQNTTGSAAKWTTARTMNGAGPFDGSANIQIPVAGSSDYTAPTPFTPTFTSLVVVNGTGSAVYTGQYSISGAWVHWWVHIDVTGTATTASTKNVTYFTGFPVIPANYETFTAVDYNLNSYGVGFAGSGTKFYTPTWTAVNAGVVLSGSFLK